ncbi:galactose transporter [Verticillium dahliae VdLs.17]|uniref:Galactose transporter n=2 Tax=Verticillium dahliae TaxID=27337 RepID=G2X5D8_VERDV|nr:galactose transporter [Verticillium dahliae VdLs.17]EGY14279.1 galactose transporter [Verticillium dahliae VdLs.17]KAH6701068.1 galactose transporter [Verticillium dahliae]
MDHSESRKPSAATMPDSHHDAMKEAPPVHAINFRVLVMGLLVSMGGFIFGYEGGAISGYLQMNDFISRFGEHGEALGKVRTGCMVAFLCAGCLIGALISAPIADKYGRKYSITFWNVIYIVGNIVAITARTTWYQVPLARLVGGLGIGALSVLTPMYQSETSPRQVRAMLVSAYQLFITLGIFTAYCINYGTESISGAASWRITMGCGFIAPAIMGLGVLTLRESPRWDFRHGRTDEAETTLALLSGVDRDHPTVQHEIRDIRKQLAAEHAEQAWHEVFTGPAMMRRTLLGMTLQALQQLTGANFFFYYGTQIFAAVGLSNSYVTSMILGAVNFASTIVGLWIGQRFGRRPALIVGGAWMFGCFLVFASLGSFALYPDNNPADPNARTDSGAGGAMIAFACLFIFGFATTWGPLVWAIVGEMFPSRYRARSMALCTASNWLWNFLISFFTPFITDAIHYKYGYVFAACCGAGAIITYFFVVESQGRSLEEVDTMYVEGVVPWKSKTWQAAEGQLDGSEPSAEKAGSSGEHLRV